MNVVIAGDFVARERVAAQIDDCNFDCLKDVKDIISKSDYSIVNLEAPVVSREAKPIEKVGPNLRCTEKAVECLAQAGFNCVTLANNHFRDYGQVGIEDTLLACKDNRIDYVGGGENVEDAERILYKNIGDGCLAIINACEKEWSIASEKHGGSAHLDPIKMYHSIVEAKENANYVLVIVHGGHEMFQLPSLRMVETYRFFIDAGADAVVNHHQHCFSGYEVYNNRPIFYGLGNFCFDREKQTNKMWNEGYMVSIIFSEKKVDFCLYPYRQCAETPRVELLPSTAFDTKIEELNSIIADADLLKKSVIDYYSKSSNHYGDIFEPTKNKFLLAAKHRGWLPSRISKSRAFQISNYLMCESHRDKLIWWVKNELSDN